MHENQLVKDCLRRHGGALLFMAPEWSEAQRAVPCQIVDVFALQVVTGYIRDPQGTLLLEAHPSVAAGRSWSVAKAAQLVRHDARPERWVVLNLETTDTAPAKARQAVVPPAAVAGTGVLQAVLWTSLAWLVVLGLTAAGFLGVLREQDRKLELLLERLPAPAAKR